MFLPTPACVICRRWKPVWIPWITGVVHLYSYPMTYSTAVIPSAGPLDGFHRQSGSPGLPWILLPFQTICWGLFQPAAVVRKGGIITGINHVSCRKRSSISGLPPPTVNARTHKTFAIRPWSQGLPNKYCFVIFMILVIGSKTEWISPTGAELTVVKVAVE